MKLEKLIETVGRENLIKAVYNQLGCESDEEFFETCEVVCKCGAAGGFTGFIYYTETEDFYRQNIREIKDLLHDYAEDMGNGSIIGLVKNFCGAKNFTEDEIWDALFNPQTEETGVMNLLAWFALEEVARLAVCYYEQVGE